MDATQIWRAALERIAQRVTSGAFSNWFRDTIALDLSEDLLVIGVGSTFARSHLEERFGETARVAVCETAGRSMRLAFEVRPTLFPKPSLAQASAPASTRRASRPRASVAEYAAPARRPHAETTRPAQPPLLIVPPQTRSATSRSAATPVPTKAHTMVATGVATSPRETAPDEAAPQPAPATPFLLRDLGAEPSAQSSLNPRYTFETFVEGTENRFSFAAANEVAGAPGDRYNPLVITGGTGLGKTHLLHAIGHRLRAAGLHVAYVTAEQFMNEIIEAIRLHTCAAFRRRYRTVDALLVDDIQFVAGKDVTELEFLHTFNALHELDKQIVLTCDRPPATLPTLHTGLRSRFASGLLADLQMPDRELRLAILHAKATSQGLTLPEDVLLFLADQPRRSVRELEGALTTVAARARLLRANPTIEDVAHLFRVLGEEPNTTEAPSPEEVLAAVARHFEVEVAELRGGSRERNLVKVRHVAMYLMREVTPASHQQIAKVLHKSDHTTVMNACLRVEQLMRDDERARTEIEALCARLRPNANRA